MQYDSSEWFIDDKVTCDVVLHCVQRSSACGSRWTSAGRQNCAVLHSLSSLSISQTGSTTDTRPWQQTTQLRQQPTQGTQTKFHHTALFTTPPVGELSIVISVRELLPLVLWRCWFGDRKGTRPVKNEWWGAGVVICLERSADLHSAWLMPLPLTVSCFSKIQSGFTFLVPAHQGSPGKRAVKRVCVW